MIAVPFEKRHFAALTVQAAQREEFKHIAVEDVLACQYPSTFLHGDDVVAIAGVVELAPQRGMIWTFLSRDIGRRMVRAVRIARRFVNILPYARLETTVDYEFEMGHRWIKLLGFECEAPRMRKYGFDGRDHALYVRIK